MHQKIAAALIIATSSGAALFASDHENDCKLSAGAQAVVLNSQDMDQEN